MVVFFLIGKNVAAENFFRMQPWYELKTPFVVSVKINIKEFSIHARIGDHEVNTVDILAFSTFVSFFSVILRIIPSQGIRKVSEAFNEFAVDYYFFVMNI